MITQEILKKLGFETVQDIFSHKKVWAIGKEEHELFEDLPIVYYNLEKQSCNTSRGEFSVITRECKTEEHIIKFIESINFLFNLTIVINKNYAG